MMNQSFIKGYNQRAADKEIILRQYSRNLIFDVLYRVGDGYERPTFSYDKGGF